MPVHQLTLFDQKPKKIKTQRVSYCHQVDLNSYDYIVILFSGGKDSLACLLHLIEAGVDLAKVELWHHEIDGREGSVLMDWPVTPAYCLAVARAFDLPIWFSWREGGFEREMLRDGTATAPIFFETETGIQTPSRRRPTPGTRRKFPQKSGDLSVRWCSAYLKIDVGRSAITNQERFIGKRTLVISGERAEESPNRANYAVFEHENHKAGRHVDRFRPVHSWSEAQVWEIIERFRVNPHPAYWLGWGRCSCLFCIFGSANQWASARKVNPEGFNRIAAYEKEFGVTLDRQMDIISLADKGTAYELDPAWIEIAMNREYNKPVILERADWRLPPGAFGESCGPT